MLSHKIGIIFLVLQMEKQRCCMIRWTTHMNTVNKWWSQDLNPDLSHSKPFPFSTVTYKITSFVILAYGVFFLIWNSYWPTLLGMRKAWNAKDSIVTETFPLARLRPEETIDFLRYHRNLQEKKESQLDLSLITKIHKDFF